MSRKIIFVFCFIIGITGVVLYGSSFLAPPSATFPSAEAMKDSVKKVQVEGRVVSRKEIAAEGGTVTFYMVDAEGNESEVFYDGANNLSAGMVQDAATGSKVVVVAGHACGGRFHAKEVMFPAY